MNKVFKFLFLLLVTRSAYSQSAYINASATKVCYGNNLVTLTLAGDIKLIKRWEMSTTAGNSWVSISNQTTSIVVGDLTQKTRYRVVMQAVDEPETYSAEAIIDVWPEANSGSISGATSVCKGNNSGEITISGHTGAVTAWEYTVDNVVWNKVASTSTAYNYNNINISTTYRAYVQSGTGCSEVPTPNFQISVDEPTNAGTIDGSNTVCKGTNSGVVNVTGNIGSVIRWETSTTGQSPWTSINETSTSLNYTNLINSTWYRAVVKNGTCTSIPSQALAITVDASSVGGVTIGQTSVCSKVNSGEVTLTGHVGNIETWQYSLDNGTTWRDTAITKTNIDYSNITQTIIYRANVKNGVCNSAISSQAKITVNPLPVVNFTAPSKLKGEAVTFSNNSSISTGYLKQYTWDFGEGNSSSVRTPIHTYANAGVYTVKLEITSDKGCADSLKKDLIINDIPEVDFTYSNVCLKEEAQFINTSKVSDVSTTYTWNFGDGSPVSTNENATHKYSLPGKYQVTLTVTTPFTSSTKTKTIEIFHQASPAFESTSACLGSNSVFINKSNIKEGYLSYIWNFGDGQTSTDINPIHTYSTTGTYTIRLITTSNNNCSDTIFKAVYVNATPQAQFAAEDVPFGNPIVFDNKSFINSGSFINSWNFGDGNNSTEDNPEHNYSSAGNYLVTLALQSDSGCTASLSKMVWVYPKPHASFVAQPVCLYDSVQFENQSTISAGSMTYLWKFGDGTTSASNNPKKKYTKSGTYNIVLIAISDKMGVDSTKKTIDIHPIPQPNFTNQNVCDGLPVSFQDGSTVEKGTITNYLWDFGDGSNAVRQSPIRQYLNAGNYHVTLKVTTDKACTASVSKDVTVYENPTAKFSIVSVCHKKVVLPQNLSESEENSNYEWNMGDGNSLNAYNVSHTYANPGLYSVQLKVTDLNGCTDSIQRNVNIYPLPNIDAGKDTSIVLGFPVQLLGQGGTNFEWYPEEGLSSAFLQNPIASPKTTTKYYLTASDQNGCINRDSITINVEDKNIIIASNILTPNGNGQNDTWHIRNIENYSDAKITIFNRWGTIVYQTTNYQNDWNGTNSNNDILPDGTYYYIIDMPNFNIKYKGAITILRNK